MSENAPKETPAEPSAGSSEPKIERVDDASGPGAAPTGAASGSRPSASRQQSAPPPSEPPGASNVTASGPRPSVRARVASVSPPLPAAGKADDADPMVGTTLLERVKIIRPIARGGMGKVYFGEQVRMKRPCAIKILDPRLAGESSSEFARRFLLEASTAAKLTHPNVVTIFDYGETDDGSCFIAMEYLEGRSLSDELKKTGPLTPERAIHIARQVCRALREAHALGVVHRDMKPGNVFLVKQDDDEDFVKVLDFGLVKETSAASEQDNHTQIGQIMGSPRYMAPEQVQGKAVDARTDIYSLGAMLYAMLAGKPPFDKATELATMMAQVSDAPPPFATTAPGLVLPAGLEAVVMKCLAKQPDDRFASMEELVTALKLQPGFMGTASDSGRHPAPAGVLSPAVVTPQPPPAPRSRLPLVAGVLVAAVGVALGVGMISRQETPTGQAAASAAPPATLATAPAPAPPPPAAPKVTATLHVETEPSGAKVKEEGETMCEATPCDIVYAGEQADPTYEHLLTFLKADYKLERKIVKISASPLSVKLSRAR